MSSTNPLNNSTVNTGYSVGTVLNPDGTTKSTSSDASNGLGEDDFMKLLVAQLKYQDPSNPADPTQFMSQTAQFSELSALQTLEKDTTQLLNSQQSTSATGMLGQTISAVNPNGGADITGTVTGVKLGTDGPVLKLGDTEVPYANVKEVDRTGS